MAFFLTPVEMRVGDEVLHEGMEGAFFDEGFDRDSGPEGARRGSRRVP
jgi:hypothetical protein